MRYQLNLALAFMRKSHGRGLFNSHIYFSILGILVGVAFLVFTLSVYDGYVKKLETMIFAFFPQISIIADSMGGGAEPPIGVITDREGPDEDAHLICNGVLILQDKSPDKADEKAQNRFELASLGKVTPSLERNQQTTTFSPVIFEQDQFRMVVQRGQEEVQMQEPIRILGVGRDGKGFVPQVDRLVTQPELLAPLRDPSRKAVLIAAELYTVLFAEEAPTHPISQTLLVDLQSDREYESFDLNPERYLKLEIVGVFRFGMHKMAENMIITSFSVAQGLFSMEGSATFLGVSLGDPYTAEVQAGQIKYNLPEGEFLVSHWLSLAGDLFQNLTLYRRIILLVLMMSIVITSFNIHNTLSIMILQRKRHIGILLSMGLRKRAIYGVFLWISLIEAAIGCLAGLALGIIGGRFFSDYLDRELAEFLPIKGAGIEVHLPTIFMIFLFVALVCGLTSLRSARAAAALNPVRCLQAD